jgi:hypothetical protein
MERLAPLFKAVGPVAFVVLERKLFIVGLSPAHSSRDHTMKLSVPADVTHVKCKMPSYSPLIDPLFGVLADLYASIT